MKTGIEQIAQERQEQIEKHGFDSQNDERNTQEELKDTAAFLLTGDLSYFPHTWDQNWIYKFSKKNRIERLKIAGALIAAEIDRLQNTKPKGGL